jgi:surface polysaccharide O-acyltransferase-like enzyme
MEKTRNYGLDILRVLACYLVIQVHTGEFYYIGAGGTVLTGDAPFWVGILNSICRISVPLFVMISGYLLLPLKDEMGTFFKKRFTRVAIPFLVWCVLYAIYWALKGQTDWAQAGINILHIPVNFGVEVGHLWYVYMLIGLYLFAPIISPWIAGASRQNMHFYLAIWAITLCLPYIHLLYPQVLGECYWNQTPLLYYFSGFLGYLILGAYIKKFMPEKKTWYLPVGLLLIIAGYAITAGGFISLLHSTTDVSKLELTWQFETINVAMMSIGIFLIFKNISFSNPSSIAARGITDISKISYGIYLAHIMVLNFFYSLFDSIISPIQLKIPLIAICTFIVSYLIIKLLSLLPKSKYIIG